MAKQETIADIIAEKRRRADELESKIIAYKNNPSKDLALETLALSLVAENRNEADRLEAAHRRERGDCAKLREAIVYMIDTADSIAIREPTGVIGKLAFHIKHTGDAALAAPPRNCDRPECATLEMATKTWIQEVFGPLCSNSKATMADIRTFDVWIYAPATEKEGGAK